MLDDVYQRGEAGPVLVEVRVPRSDGKLQIRLLRTGRSGTPAFGRQPVLMNGRFGAAQLRPGLGCRVIT